LLLLDQASDFATAQDLLHRIHAQVWAEVLAIPLWELQPVMAVRKNLRGLAERPFRPYHGIERWRVESWYPRD
jgi:ABC-type transport system substrate-binding protein